MQLDFDNTYFHELEGLSVPHPPEVPPAPRLLRYNRALAAELGLPAELEERAVDLLSGKEQPAGSEPLAQAYAGHQFGHFNPHMGDGRAILLGELRTDKGRVDLQLKGSGRTPFSRGGDGRATVGPILRELLVSEAMHALGVPTTRVLATVATGHSVRRERMLPGALLARVASSHIRVGTFQFFAARQDHDKLQRLVDYSLARHFPDAEGATPAEALLRATAERQGRLIGDWMALGFVHGVMNTDNTAISGETIDYGPCAFMEAYDPATVFSSIDRHGRYAFGKQPGIGGWNLARLAEALLPLLAETEDEAVALAQGALSVFADTYNPHWLGRMRAKTGLVTEEEGDLDLMAGLLELLWQQGADMTSFFRGLSQVLRGSKLSCLALVREPAALDAWLETWQERLSREGREQSAVASEMDAVNPVYVPRNHLVEEALTAAVDGDLAPFDRLLERVRNPFDELEGEERYAEPAPGDFGPYVTFCGT